MFAPHESKLNEKKSSIACELLITFECNTRPRPIYRQKKIIAKRDKILSRMLKTSN